MIGFKKAAPEQAKLKVSVYGPSGSGKTFTTLLMAEGLALTRGKRVAFVDTERGSDFYAMSVKQRQVHPEAFDFDAIYTRSIHDIDKAVKSLNPKDYGVIVIDSISHVWDAAQEAYTGKRQSDGGIPFGGWAKLKKPYKDLVNWLVAAPFDVFLLGRQKSVYEDIDDTPKKVGYAMRAEGETQYEPHICLRMESRKDPANPLGSIYEVYVEKDRTGVLSGRVLRAPSFATIQPLLPLLGEKQAEMEDEDERIARDSEMIDAQDEKLEKKAAKSRELLAKHQGAILSASSVEDLGKLALDIKKEKRYLLEEHLAALQEVYKARRDQIVGKAAPEVGA